MTPRLRARSRVGHLNKGTKEHDLVLGVPAGSCAAGTLEEVKRRALPLVCLASHLLEAGHVSAADTSGRSGSPSCRCSA
jgi:hypothetical protein